MAPAWLWIPAARLRPGSPKAEAPAPRVFHLNPHVLAPRIFHLDGHALEQRALEQVLAPGVFHFNGHAPEQALAPRVLYRNRRDPAPGVFHFNHRLIRQVLAPNRLASMLNAVWRDPRGAECSILHTPLRLQFKAGNSRLSERDRPAATQPRMRCMVQKAKAPEPLPLAGFCAAHTLPGARPRTQPNSGRAAVNISQHSLCTCVTLAIE